MRLTDRAHHVRDPHAAAQRDVVGRLDDGAVQYGVAVRQSHLDDVGAAGGHGLDGLDGTVHGREAGRQIGDQRGPVLGLRGGESGVQQLDVAAHLTSPSISAPSLPASASTAASVSYSPK